MIPAMTDFRARGTIMGLAGLTAVFGMGTGVTPPVWSPEKRPAGGQAGPGTVRWVGSVGHTRHDGTFRCSESTLPFLTDPTTGPRDRWAPPRGGSSEPIGVVKLLGC